MAIQARLGLKWIPRADPSWATLICRMQRRGLRPDMDFSPLVHQVFSTLWWLPFAVILISIIKSPWFKGIVGEFWINLSSRFILDKHIYRLVKNVTLPTADGTTQIDHVIVSLYGVFVIETKKI